MVEAVERLNEVLADPDSTMTDKMEEFERTLLQNAKRTGEGSLFGQFADNETGRANLRETKTILRDYGVSWEEFVDNALSGGLRFNAMTEDVLGQRRALFLKAPAFGGGQFGAEAFTGKSVKELGRELTLLTELFDKTRLVFKISKDLRSEADREAALASPFTLEQELAALHSNLDDINGIVEKLPEESLLELLSEAIGEDADQEKAVKFLEDFNEGISEFGEDVLEVWEESFRH